MTRTRLHLFLTGALCGIAIGGAVAIRQAMTPRPAPPPDSIEALNAAATLEGFRFCGLDDNVLAQTAGQCRWPDKRVTWFVRDTVPGLSLEECRADARWVMGQLAASCGLIVSEAPDAASARVLYVTRRLDGPQGVLAQAQLPCGPIQQSRVEFDSGEQWGKLGDARRVIYRLVNLHETCHAVGVGHLNKPPTAVMNPTYNASLQVLQTADVAELVERYGPPAPPPAPNGNPGVALPAEVLADALRKAGWTVMPPVKP
jgi:hypothetical protein